MNIKYNIHIHPMQLKQFFRGKCIALYAYIRKKKRSKIKDIGLYLKKLENSGKLKPNK